MSENLDPLRRPKPLGVAPSWSYDFETLLSKGDLSSYPRIRLFVLHEAVHWLQHIGTTIGVFLSLCKRTRDASTLHWLSRIDKLSCEHLLFRRLNDRPKPIIPISHNDYRLLYEGEFPEDVDIFRQVIYDIWWTHNVQYGGIGNSRLYKMPQEILSFALRDVTNQYYEDIGKTNFVSAFPVEGNCRQFLVEGAPLTTYSLLEASALANEIILRLRSKEELESSILAILLRRDYFAPMRLWWEMLSLDEKDFLYNPQQLLVFLIVCDIALNPPLPPFVNEPPSGKWSWEDIHPPARFLKILSSIAKLMEIQPKGAAHDEICSIAGITSPLSFSLNDPIPYSFNSNDIVSKDYKPLPDAEYHHFLYWCIQKAWDVRKKNWANLGAPSVSNDWDLTIKERKLKVKRSGDLAEPFMSPPILLNIDNEVAHSQPFSQSFSKWLAKASAKFYPIYDLAFGQGHFSLDLYPDIISCDVNNLNYIADWLEKTVGVEGWCKFTKPAG